MTRKKKMLLGIGLVVGVTLAGVGTWVVLNLAELKASYSVSQLRKATTDEERTKAADGLVAMGEPGLKRLVELTRSSDQPSRTAASGALDRHLATLPDGDAKALSLVGQLLEGFPASDAAGQTAVLELLPVMLKKTGSAHATKCKTVVAAGLKMPDPATRVFTTRLAMHPEIQMRQELVPLLTAPEAEVRQAALFAVAAAVGEPLLGDEDLFHFLHDSDEGVRKVCRDALVGRDRTEVEIALGRRLTDPDPVERLKLLLDLRYEDDVADPEPWLERMSRDADPAVRVGAARVALEVTVGRQLDCPGWIGRVTDSDPDPTVRRIATYFRRQVPSRVDPNVRNAGAP